MGVQIPHVKGREGAAHCKVQGLSAVNCAKIAELIETPLGLWTSVGTSKHVLDQVQIGDTW